MIICLFLSVSILCLINFFNTVVFILNELKESKFEYDADEKNSNSIRIFIPKQLQKLH